MDDKQTAEFKALWEGPVPSILDILQRVEDLEAKVKHLEDINGVFPEEPEEVEGPEALLTADSPCLQPNQFLLDAYPAMVEKAGKIPVEDDADLESVLDLFSSIERHRQRTVIFTLGLRAWSALERFLPRWLNSFGKLYGAQVLVSPEFEEDLVLVWGDAEEVQDRIVVGCRMA
jgi:hypothetical protein